MSECGFQELNTGPWKEQYAQLIAEPSLHPFNILVSIKTLKYICILTHMYIDMCI